MAEIGSVPTKTFSYVPLSQSSSIRVLKVEAGQEPDDVVCTLSEVSLEGKDQVEYEALSYVWGDSRKTHRVTCDGWSLGVTANLHAAIRNFRHSDHSRVLWADAICINQGNPEEKGTQVAMMRDVYKQAQQVLIWLGERDDLDDKAFDLIKDLSSYFGKNEKVSTLPPLWSCLRTLLERPWFTRTWIVQEAGNARRGVVAWGGRSVDLEEFLGVADGISQRNALLSELFSDGQMRIVDYEKLTRALSCLKIIRLWRDKSTNLGLISWLSYTRDLSATDARDKVFWQYGYLHPSIRDQFPIDYTTEVVTVYRNLTTTLLKGDGLNILSYVSRSSRPSKTLMPSWVPDWTVRQYVAPFSAFSIHFNAAGDRPKSFSSLENVLKIVGVGFDKVSEAKPLLGDLENADEMDLPGYPARLNDWLTSTKSMTALTGRYSTRESIDTAFWKILTCDTGPDGLAVSDEYSAHFEEYKKHMHIQSQTDKTKMGWVAAEFRDTFDSALKFADLFHKVSAGRLFCAMESGCIGWTPAETQSGDLICIFYGGKTPYVIRPIDENYYTFIGECYIHGMMHGEVLHVDDVEEKEFWLK